MSSAVAFWPLRTASFALHTDPHATKGHSCYLDYKQNTSGNRILSLAFIMDSHLFMHIACDP